MMERLTKRQREILFCLKEVFPEQLNENILLTKLRGKPTDIDILADIKILEEKTFVTVGYGTGSYFPVHVKITPKGIEKLQETFTTRLWDAAHNNPWIAITVVVSLILGAYTVSYYSQTLMSQKLNFDLQNKIIQENELKQTMPPTVWLTQEFRNGSSGELEIIPTLYFKKNSDRLFTISYYEVNFTLNGKHAGRGGGYESKFKNEGINEGKIVFPIVYPPSISEYNFFHGINDLVIDYVLEIKDMDSQRKYRGKITTEINSSISPPPSFPSGHEPLIFNWIKV